MTIHMNATSNFHLQALDLLDVPTEPEGSGEGSDAGSDLPPAPQYLTDASMLAYCGTQMQQIDSQIQTMFASQQKQNQEQQIINQALQVLQGCADGTLDGNGKSAPSQKQCLAMQQALEQAISQIEDMDPNAACLPQLEQLHDNLMATGTGSKTNGDTHGFYGSGPTDSNPTPDSTISGQEMAGFINSLQNIGTGMNSDAQLRMIQIQSLVSQQQTAVELTTNIMQTLDDSMKKVVDNIHS
jgi:hypothetical protein